MPDALLHNWKIDPRQYERQEQRRGKRHAYRTLNPRTTALIVVDMVPFFLNENPYCRGIVPNIQQLADTLRENGGTVAWVLPGAVSEVSPVYKEFYGDEVAQMFNNSGGDGPLQERLWHEFKVHENDVLAEKTAASAFFPGRTTLPPQLEERNIDTVLITGTVTNVCCEATARDAFTLDYRVIMVADANASVDDASHNATLHTIYRSFGDVRPTREVIDLIVAGQ